MSDNHIPLVRGGQGRSAADLTASARALVVFLGVAGIVALAVASWL